MSQTTKTYQYDRNDNNTFGVRGAATGGGTEVVANPEGAATTDLEKLQVGETIYGIPEGTNVEANPTLAGTESALTGLQVGDTKYKVPDGYVVHTYQENKTYTSSDSDYEQLRSDLSNAFPIQIGNYVYDCIYNTAALKIYATFYQVDNSSSIGKAFYTITISSNSVIISAQTTASTGVVDVANSGSYKCTYLKVGAGNYYLQALSSLFTTTAPTADNNDGGIRFVVLTSEPATYYNGYYYIIAPTT